MYFSHFILSEPANCNAFIILFIFSLLQLSVNYSFFILFLFRPDKKYYFSYVPVIAFELNCIQNKQKTVATSNHT